MTGHRREDDISERTSKEVVTLRTIWSHRGPEPCVSYISSEVMNEEERRVGGKVHPFPSSVTWTGPNTSLPMSFPPLCERPTPS